MFSTSNLILGGFNQSVVIGYYSNYNTGVINGSGPFGLLNQYGNAIAVGNNAAQFSQGTNAIAFGLNAGQYSQGKNAIAIGMNAGLTMQAPCSVVINASGNVLSDSNNYACYINPIRDNNSAANKCLTYSPDTFEVNYNSAFRFVPWTDCGYTVVAGSSFGGLVTASPGLPVPAFGSLTTYKYSVIGNTMYLQFTHSNPTSNTRSAGNGVYFYNLPSGYTINTNLVQLATATTMSANQTAYGTPVGHAALEQILGSSPSAALSATVYCCFSTRLSIFIPAWYYGGSLYKSYQWQSLNLLSFGDALTHCSFNACFPIN